MQVSLTASVTDISANLKCVVNPSSLIKCGVVQKSVGMYTITITPQVRGRHDLIVKVKNEEIDGSPFRMFVKIPPSQLGHYAREIGGPRGIAINNKQQLMVAESGYGSKKITIMERDGKKVQTIECGEFHNPCGVASSADGAIYVIDREARCLFKFNSSGTLLKTVRNELKEPYSVKIIQNQLYVVASPTNHTRMSTWGKIRLACEIETRCSGMASALISFFCTRTRVSCVRFSYSHCLFVQTRGKSLWRN